MIGNIEPWEIIMLFIILGMIALYFLPSIIAIKKTSAKNFYYSR
jgi:hypothetical protein